MKISSQCVLIVSLLVPFVCQAMQKEGTEMLMVTPKQKSFFLQQLKDQEEQAKKQEAENLKKLEQQKTVQLKSSKKHYIHNASYLLFLDTMTTIFNRFYESDRDMNYDRSQISNSLGRLSWYDCETDYYQANILPGQEAGHLLQSFFSKKLERKLESIKDIKTITKETEKQWQEEIALEIVMEKNNPKVPLALGVVQLVLNGDHGKGADRYVRGRLPAWLGCFFCWPVDCFLGYCTK